MSRYLKALRKRGIDIRLSKRGGLIIPKAGTSESMRKQISDAKNAIMRELSDEIITERKYILIDSAVLGGRIAIGDMCPDGLVSYTWEEAKQLIGSDPEMLKLVHSVKKSFPHSIVETILDPRPDIEEDSDVWCNLLAIAQKSKLYGALHYFRCEGTRLHRYVTGWNLKYDPETSGFASKKSMTICSSDA